MVEGSKELPLSISLQETREATPINTHAGRFSVSPGNQHQRIVIEGIGRDDLRDLMAIRYADKPPLLGSWNWKQVQIKGKTIYVNINSLAKRLGISKNEAKKLVKDGFEAGFKGRAENILKRLEALGVKNASDLIKGTTVTFRQVLSAVTIKEIEDDLARRRGGGLHLIMVMAIDRTFVYSEGIIYQVQGELGRGSYKKVDSYVARIFGKESHVKALSVPKSMPGKFALTQYQTVVQHIKQSSPKWQSYCHLPDTESVVSMEDQGVPLKGVMSRLHKLKPPLTQKDVADQMLECLNFLHKNNICHGDLKPDNFILFKQEDGTWRLKMIDFDDSCVLKPSDNIGPAFTQAYASPQTFLPDPEYKTSESLQGRDIFAIGVILSELFDLPVPSSRKHILKMSKDDDVGMRDYLAKQESHVDYKAVSQSLSKKKRELYMRFAPLSSLHEEERLRAYREL